MAKPSLKLKTPLNNMALNLRGDVNSATEEELLEASLGRRNGHFFDRCVFTYAKIADSYLSVNGNDCALWIGKAAFEILVADVDLIVRTFGIRVVRHGEGQTK